MPERTGKTVYASEAARHHWMARKVVERAKLAALTKLIADNQGLLGAIRERTPASVAELARCVQRSDSNASGSLGKLVKFGIVSLVDAPGRSTRPVLATDKLLQEIDVVSGRAVIRQHGEHRGTAAKAKEVVHA